MIKSEPQKQSNLSLGKIVKPCMSRNYWQNLPKPESKIISQRCPFAKSHFIIIFV